jgi:hypothetical protein
VTSNTDKPGYREFCALAARDPEVFATFRQHPAYVKVLRTTRENGQRYLNQLTARPYLATDLTGGPLRFDYGEWLDPVMIRYYHHRQEVWRLFGDTTKFHILEIGGGFGGFARLFDSGVYSILDLPEARQLQDTYLQAVCGHGVRSATPGRTYDLVISTYAFSELNRDVQMAYARDYLAWAPRGWMIYNFINPSALRADEVLALFPGSRWEAEDPLTDPLNRVLIWGDQ